MRHPAVGLLWHSWRLSRRWYLLILAIAVALNLTIMNAAPPGIEAIANRREYLASSAVIVGVLLSLFTTLVAISLGGRAGFPMRFEFRLPVSTALLVGMPMLVLGMLCGSLYMIPLLLDRILYGLPMPLMAGAVLVGTTAALLAAASWTAATSPARAAALILAVAAGSRLIAWMQPIHFQNGVRTGSRVFDPQMISLSVAQYALLALLVLLLFALTSHSVGLQRQSERWRFGTSSIKAGGVGAAGIFDGALMDRASALLRIPCPTSSAWSAELWLECKRRGVPLLLLGLLFALLIAMAPLADSLLGSAMAPLLATAAPLVLFFAGIGMGIFNRRVAAGGYMNPFEGTRSLGTPQLAGIQLGTLGTSLLLGTVLIGVSLWLSAPLYDDVGALWSRAATIIHVAQDGSFTQQAGTAATMVVGYFALLAFFFCVHSCSMFWGRKVMYGTLAFLIYAAIFAHTALTDASAGAFVVKNMWGFAGLVLTLTLLLVTRITALRLLTVKAGAVTALIWSIGLACAYLMLELLDVHVLTQRPELQALNGALAMLPLTLFLGTLWCYDRLRHR